MPLIYSTPPAGKADDAALSAAASPASVSRRKKRSSRDWVPYVFISPFFILFGVFSLFPLLFSIYLSFNQWDAASGLDAMNWVGLANYQFALTDPWFTKSLWNTFWLALVSGIPQHLVAIPLAAFIQHAFKRSRNAVIGAYFLPFITSSVAIAMVFSTMFSKDYGQVNILIGMLAKLPVISGFFPADPIDWLGNPAFIKPAVAFVVFWRYLGWNLVLYISALQIIPKDLYEAATIDGASKRQQFWYITLPQLRPMIFLAVTMTIIGNLQLFEEPFILVGESGGVGQAGMTTAMFMYKTAFSSGDFGTASAISWLLFLIISVIAWGNHRLLGRADK